MKTRMLLILMGPISAAMVPLVAGWLMGAEAQPMLMLGVLCWMALWWFTDVVHHAVTAFVPLLALPVLGISDSRTIAMQYTDPIIFLFMGGFILALAMERWNLHRRIALVILSAMGSRPPFILLGVMASAYLTSMWISNTATVMMLLPAVLAVIQKLEEAAPNKGGCANLSAGILLGLAYAASIGGMATPVGTPTNMIFMREYASLYPDLPAISFPEWMVHALPVSFLLFAATFLWLLFLYVKESAALLPKGFFAGERKLLGKLSYEEKVVFSVFLLTAVLWVTRADMQLGFAEWRGWSSLLGFAPEAISDATVAIGAAILLFMIPSKNERGRSIMEWEEASKLPFDVVLLFGGGFAMAKGVEVSGLGTWLAAHLQGLSEAPSWMVLLGIALLIAIISEFASNVACIQLMLPILAAMQPQLPLSPIELMIPATLAASLGFMMPIATAPNTIVFSTRRITMRQILWAGLWVDVFGIILIVLLS